MTTKPINGPKVNTQQTLGVGEINREGKAGRAGAANENVKTSQNYDVSLSDKSREIANLRAKALEIARQTPDIRNDRVEAIKKQIAEGTYQIDSGKIADGMLREAILDKLATMPDE
jgi:negative regulator of flagellin synthesis FlgM